MYHDYFRNILDLYYLWESYPEFVAAVTSFSKWQKKRKKPTKQPHDAVTVPAGGPAALLKQT